jgi:hypothetical protein
MRSFPTQKRRESTKQSSMSTVSDVNHAAPRTPRNDSKKDANDLASHSPIARKNKLHTKPKLNAYVHVDTGWARPPNALHARN